MQPELMTTLPLVTSKELVVANKHNGKSNYIWG